MSRYGIDVSEEDVKAIFFDLAGGDSDADCIDIPEVVAILIIPFLRKIVALKSQENDTEDSSAIPQTYLTEIEREAFMRKQELLKLRASNGNIIDYVLKMILHEVAESNADNRHAGPEPLTKDLLRRIFNGFGEEELGQDDELLAEMIGMAVGDSENGTVLDAEAFSRGLTSDIMLYDLTKETRFSTHYEDVFGIDALQDNDGTIGDPATEAGDTGASNTLSLDPPGIEAEGKKEVKKVFTFSQIDYVADTFRSKTYAIFVWVAAWNAVQAYIPLNGIISNFCEEGQRLEFGCNVGRYVVFWLVILALML